MVAAPRDFDCEPLRCRWQALPASARAQDIADAWLRGIADDAVADGMHRDARGRPRLRQGDIGWSHSHGRLLIAHARHGSLGVDVEAFARHADGMRIARRYFATSEVAALDALVGDARQPAFLRLWCAKEAVLKAHGGGIAFGLHRVVFDPGSDRLQLLDCDPALGSIGDWRFHESAPEPGFIAVLAWTAGILSP